MQVDHVLLAGDRPLPSRTVTPWRGNLDSFAGGRHSGWGTSNRIVPLGDAYLELVSIVDANEARSGSFGRWALDAAMRPGLPFGWAVRPSDFDAAVERLGLDVHDGSRATPSGESVTRMGSRLGRDHGSGAEPEPRTGNAAVRTVRKLRC